MVSQSFAGVAVVTASKIVAIGIHCSVQGKHQIVGAASIAVVGSADIAVVMADKTTYGTMVVAVVVGISVAYSYSSPLYRKYPKSTDVVREVSMYLCNYLREERERGRAGWLCFG